MSESSSLSDTANAHRRLKRKSIGIIDMGQVFTQIKLQLKQKSYTEATRILLEYVKGGEEQLWTKAIEKSDNFLEGVEKNVPTAEFRKYKSRFTYFLNQTEKKHQSALPFLDALYVGQKLMNDGEWQQAIPHLKQAFSLHDPSFSMTQELLATMIDQCECCVKFEASLKRAHQYEKQQAWTEAVPHYRKALRIGEGISLLTPLMDIAAARLAYCQNIEPYAESYQRGVEALEGKLFTQAKDSFQEAKAFFIEGFMPDQTALDVLIDQCEYGEMLQPSLNLKHSEGRRKRNGLVFVSICLLPLLFFFGHTMWTVSPDHGQSRSELSKLTTRKVEQVSDQISSKENEQQVMDSLTGTNMLAYHPPAQRRKIESETFDATESNNPSEKPVLYETAVPMEPMPSNQVTRSQKEVSPAMLNETSVIAQTSTLDTFSEESKPETSSTLEASTVAILPFCDGTGEASLAQGLFMDATHALSKSGIPSLSRNRLRASLRHQNLNADQCSLQYAEEVASQLQLGKILVGSLTREGDVYQITCKVFHPETSQFGKEFIVSHSDPSTLRTKLQHEIPSIFN